MVTTTATVSYSPLQLSLLPKFIRWCPTTISSSSSSTFLQLSPSLPKHDAWRTIAMLFSNSRDGFCTPTSTSSWTNATDSDCCVGWHGVTCDPLSAGEVTSLDLNGLFLEGMVDPDALFSLTSLTTLNLADNFDLNFSEVLSSPRAFEKLHRLKVLNLSHSGFRGQIPMGIPTLANLTSLDMSSNLWLDGSLPEMIGGLVSLESLQLSNCNLSGSIPEWIFLLENLRNLDVSLNFNLGGSLPKMVRGLGSLESLNLASCNLSGSIPERIFHLENLRNLDMSSNWRLGGSLPKMVRGLGSLETLKLSDCNLSGSIPEWIFHLENLTRLDMSGNRLLGGSLPKMVRGVESLERLKLSNCNLSGSIPERIFLLENLRSLDMSGNRLLGGSLPNIVRGLESLESLKLSNCNLSGSIPERIFLLENLRKLDLQQNKLSSNLGELFNASAPLETVELSSNNFGGEVRLNRLVGLQNLSSLGLSHNRLTVMGSESSDAVMKNSAFPKMINLKLASCNITRFPLFLKDQAELEHLDLSLNRIAGNIPSWLWTIGGGTNSLKFLNLSHNNLTGFEEPLFDPVNSSLQTIDLHSNQLKGSFPLPPSGNEFVDYSNNYLSSEIPENISQYLKHTNYFLMSNNNLSGKILPNFCESRQLQFLDVSFNYFSGPIPPCLGQLSSLTVVNLGGNRFGDIIPSDLFNSTNCRLKALTLNNNQLSGYIPMFLRNCQDLQILDLGNNRFDGEFPGWLGNLSYLSVLILKSNRFDGPVDVSNGSFKRLQIVDLSSNNFSGDLPLKLFLNMTAMMMAEHSCSQPIRDWDILNDLSTYYIYMSVNITKAGVALRLEKICPFYTSIDVSNNSFVGCIPDEMGKLIGLAFLNASHNHLSGVIPRSVGNLTKLQELDLSNNQLSGQIPRELSKLNFLSVLNLSCNKLSGAIPRGKQFNTFKNNSFLGNSGLCGFPLENSCSNSTTSHRDTLPSHHENKSDWWVFLFAGLGFGWGFVLIVASLLLCRRWGKMFNNWVDYTLFPIVTSLWRNCMRPLDRQSERAK